MDEAEDINNTFFYISLVTSIASKIRVVSNHFAFRTNTTFSMFINIKIKLANLRL